MTIPEPPRVHSTEEAKGADLLRRGAVAGLGGATLSLVVPMASVYLALAHPGGVFGITPPFLRLTSLLVVAGASLLFVSFVLFRSGFAHLRHADRRFRVVSALCLVGSVGLLALVAAGLLVADQPGPVATCVVRPLGPVLTCLQSAAPYGADLGLAGFILSWLGGVGIVLGFVIGSTHFEPPELLLAAVAYGALLCVLVLPVEGALNPLPGVRDLLLAGPPLALAAPGLVLLASDGPLRPIGSDAEPVASPPGTPTDLLKNPDGLSSTGMTDSSRPATAGSETATLAGGCFWCTEAVFSALRGVSEVIPGYTGGTVPRPSYEDVCTGETGHAEAVEVTFDPKEISFHDLLVVFFTTHDPTTVNRQGHDVGTQYRSAVFYHSPGQKSTAESVVREITDAGVWRKKIVTEVVPAAEFFPAEEYHRRYFERNPERAYCQTVIAPKVAKFRKEHAAQLKFA
jgi:peptide-methionine (S)-S-oxide reductase